MPIKTKLILRLSIGVICGLLLTLPLQAENQTTTVDHNQPVLLKSSQSVRGAKRLGKSNFYKTDLANAKKHLKSPGNQILSIQNYRPSLEPDDPLEPQSYLTLLNASSLWDETTGTDSQTVAVIDSGFALEHQDLADRWYVNQGEYGATASEGPAPNCTSRSLALDKSCNNIDDDGNGYVDDWRGWDLAYGDNEPLAGTENPSGDAASHGTQVAGLIGVTGNNSTGAASINWASKIMPLQIFTDDGDATTVELAEAISYALDQGADVINLSLGSTATDQTVESLLIDADAQNTVVVAAAGNCGNSSYALNGCDYQGQILYPATSARTIAAGASDLTDNRASFSSYGSQLDVMAPGSGAMASSSFSGANATSLYSTNLLGTSFSAPVTSGTMASLRAQWPAASAKQLRAVLIDSVTRPSGMGSSIFTTTYGFGRIRPYNGALLAQQCQSVNAADINCDGSVGIADLSLLASRWQISRSGRTDINLSGNTEIADLSLLASNWGN